MIESIRRSDRAHPSTAGMTVLEILVAIFILAVLLSPVLDLILLSFRGNEASINEIVYTNLGNELIDSVVNADNRFVLESIAFCGGDFRDLVAATVPERKLFLRSEIPSNTREVAFRVDPVGPDPGTPKSCTIRVRLRWEERLQSRTIQLARFFSVRVGE